MTNESKYSSERLKQTGSYPFRLITEKVAQLKEEGIDVIPFGVGDPAIPTPKLIREALVEGVELYKASGYPSYAGADWYRESIASWVLGRFGVQLNPETEICASIGSKEAIFNFHEGVVNSDDIVLIPTPGYPPYGTGTHFAEGKAWYYPISEENNFLPNLQAIPADILDRAKMIWVNYPNSPTGTLATDSFYIELLEFAQKHNIIVASDEAYTEIYYDKKPKSILEFGKKGVIVFQSFSKRSAMTGWRIGWVMGDEELITIYRKVKTNVDSGTPTFIQHAAVAAINDEQHVSEMREDYRIKRDIICSALEDCGLEKCLPESAIYVWQKVPEGWTDEKFATMLLDPKIAIVATPGSWLGKIPNGMDVHPGSKYVRFALVPTIQQCKTAATRLREFVKV